MTHSHHLSALASLALLFGALCFGGPARALEANDPHGLWLRPEGGVRFSFYDCGDSLCAKVVGVQKAEDQAGVGTVILRDAKKTTANEWRGKLYNVKDGKVYDGYISVKADGDLSVKGCILGVLCGGETWKRIAPPAAAAVSTKPRSPDAKTEARTARPDHAISASEQ
jgi:uncharacterized protein (DUF2147 family)